MKIIKKYKGEEIINMDKITYGRFGIIFSKDDMVYQLPDTNDYNQKIDRFNSHDKTIQWLFTFLYKKYINEFNDNLIYIANNYLNGQNFVDAEELVYAIFLASKGEIVFLDSSSEYFKSGVLFIPKNIEILTDNQRKLITKFKNQLSNYNCEILLVPEDLKEKGEICLLHEFNIENQNNLILTKK